MQRGIQNDKERHIIEDNATNVGTFTIAPPLLSKMHCIYCNNICDLLYIVLIRREMSWGEGGYPRPFKLAIIKS